jgi:hypothetical protein
MQHKDVSTVQVPVVNPRPYSGKIQDMGMKKEEFIMKLANEN